MTRRMPVGILGATGLVGQRYAALLADHPWFEVAYLAASPDSAGRSYAEALGSRWRGPTPLPTSLASMPLHAVNPDCPYARDALILFSAASSPEIEKIEEAFAARGYGVISHSSKQRAHPDIPVMIPEINPDHIYLLASQQKQRGWQRGWIAAKPNCSLQSYLTPLYALHSYGLEKVALMTMQALSGGGLAALGMKGNVIPHIPGEEEKSEQEPLKILGKRVDGAIQPAMHPRITAHCNRVAVLDGHVACVSFSLRDSCSEKEVQEAWQRFVGKPQELSLPSAPRTPILFREEPDRPQPLLDSDEGQGMSVTVGRLRSCNLLDYRFVGLSHNLVRGAAGGGLLIAELILATQPIKLG